ncbi:glycosyl transferase group 1 [Prosthecochloris aestuarii DSM 271]|uniref:Glycosyl transferase group 1 n=2 Tax=Prosthecochloris aestuarii TaxID=1102 RepID=B4S4G5_PROA2|nr:glycosyl transferase group 1 [Prosthecochloris aestuarii DSM 271]
MGAIRKTIMNILFLNSARRNWGGNERSIQLVAEALSDEHGVVLAYRSELIGSHFGITKYRLPFLHEADLYTIARLKSIIIKHRIDVIIPTKRKDYALAGIVSRITGIKNIIWLGANRPLKNTWYNKLVYKSLSNGIIVNAMQIQQTLLKTPFLTENDIRVIYNGIDTRLLDRRATKKKKSCETFTVSAMGRLDSNKGFDFLLKSFARLLKNRTDIDARLIIIGDGPLKNNYAKLARTLDIAQNVRFCGYLSDPYPELLESDVYVSSSISEGLSIALLEAMYLANAPISTLAGGGVREIIKNGTNGFLVDFGDEQALADILYRLYSDRILRKTIAERAVTTVMERYSMQKILHEIIDFCQTA